MQLKTQYQEETKEIAENLKTVSKNNKKHKEIKAEIDKLGNQNLKVLSAEIG